MVFSDTSGLGGIVEDIDFLCGSDSTSYPLKDKARNVNLEYFDVVLDIARASGRWQFDDTNQTTLPKPTFDLVNGQFDYSLPDGILKLDGVEIKDNGGNWIRLTEISTEDMRRTITDFEKTPGTPKYYDVVGGSVMLYPAPATNSVTLTAGGKLHLSRDFSPFVYTDTTKAPGFEAAFHQILSAGAAYRFLVINSTQDKADRVLTLREKIRGKMVEFYSSRNRDKHNGIRPAHRTSQYE